MKAGQGIVILAVALLLTGDVAQGSIPPHPRVRRMIAEGRAELPYYLRHREELRRRGLNAPWAAPELRLQRSMSPFPPARSLGSALVPQGPFKALLILVDFSDNVQGVEATFFDSLIFQDTTGTMRDYFKAVSYENLDVVTVNLPSAVGWVRADSAYSYYVDGQNGFGTYPRNAQKLVEDVVIAVDTLFPELDFSQYDNDGNDYVDALFIVHAGSGAEYTGSDNDIWSHAWVTSYNVLLDGVYVYRYSMEPEYWAIPGDMTIGVYAHELGHAAFGLPDLYDRDEEAPSEGLGDWSLMASGSWNGVLGDSPAFPDAWSAVQMGYVTPVNVGFDTPNLYIAEVESSAVAYQVWTEGVPGTQYFLLENRQQVGYDAALPGSGLLIYHVDESVATQNDNEWYPGHTDYGHYLVALEQADGLWDLEQATDYPYSSSDGGDPYPGATNNRHFYDFSIPSSRAYDGSLTGVAVTHISHAANTIWADLTVIPIQQQPAIIRSITDIPGDQGGVVEVIWEASPDESDSLNPVTAYGLWLKDTTQEEPTAPWKVISLEDGTWLEMGFVDSVGDSTYTSKVVTFIDSNYTGLNRSYFRVAAYAADSLVTATSLVVSGYSVDNLTPSVPTGLAVAVLETGIRLSWSYDIPAVEDFQYFAVYRGNSADFQPHPDSTCHVTVDTFFVDGPSIPAVIRYYRVAAVDHNGNYSDLTEAISEAAVGLVDGRGVPEVFALGQNHPNPFNPSTAIRFDVPEAGRLSLVVYDILGREVVRLRDGYVEPGYHRVVWNGRTAAGREAPTGVYLLQMKAPGHTRHIKMLLLK